MSRIGRMPITVPADVDVKIGEGNVVTVKGPKGELTQSLRPEMIITMENGHIHVARPSEDKLHRSLHGLTRSLINDMVVGVTKGFQKELEINGVGYRASKEGNKLVMNLGYSHLVTVEEIDGNTIGSKDRMIGNYMFTCDELNCEIVGFENHSGKTYLGAGVKPMGKVLAGFGNNGEDGTEGARYKNVFGTYSHGSLLPKNPKLADHILRVALERKYGEAELTPLDDSLENAAHDYMKRRLEK